MKILIVGPSWVGDMVMAQSLFILLKQQHPEAEIEVLAPPWTNPLLARMPEVAASLSLPFGHGELRIKERFQLGKSLRGEYDRAIVLPNSLKSALIPAFAKIPIRTGWRGEMRFGLLNDIRLLDKNKYPLMVQRFDALAFENGKDLPTELPNPALVAEPISEETLQNLGLHQDRPVVAFCPGAEFGPAKRWPEEHYAEVAKAQINAGRQVWLFGSAKDEPVAETIRAELDENQQIHCHSLAGKTELATAIDLLATVAAVVTNDSGLMHVAAALGKPLVAIYGSTSPGFTPPLSKAVSIQSIEVECGPCFQRECPHSHLKCLRELPAERVNQALESLLLCAS